MKRKKNGRKPRYNGFLKFAFARFPFCQYCNSPLILENDFKKIPREYTASTDHIIPFSLGGSDNWNNLVISCKLCNENFSNQFPKASPKHGPKLWDIIRQVEIHRRQKRESKKDQ